MKKLTIWIFDDAVRDLKKAEQAVAQVADRLGYAFDVHSISNWARPGKGQPAGHLPDIVILDLTEDSKLRGDAVYEELRTQEKQRRRPPALVAIWSGRWDIPQAVSFVEEKRSDPFMYALDCKSRHDLAKVVEGFVKRIEEERVA
jgi:hypothetical protein